MLCKRIMISINENVLELDEDLLQLLAKIIKE